MEAAQKAQDQEDLERLFPTYETDSWDQRETRAKATLEELLEVWEFATGLNAHEEQERFLAAIGDPPTQWDWRCKVHLCTLRKKMDSSDVKPHYDFYHDANPGEVRLLYAPLTELLVRVSELRSTYESASVLGEILSVGAKTLQLPVFHTPVMQALTCTDHVLAKCQEWEDYASTAVSLRPVLNPLYALIKRWRQLETQTWQSLVFQQERHYILQDLPLWTGFVLAVEDASADKDLYEVLEEFLRTSTMALFPHRLRMLRPYFSKSQVFAHIHCYFSQFLEDFEIVRKELAGDVSEEIAEAVKLTKYDMSNYHALKDSIMRQQRHLHKLVRSYSLALESRFQECVLQRVRERYLNNILEQPITLLQTEDRTQGESRAADIEELCGEIFERLEALKAHMGESALRHKALQDLFASLSDLGVSAYADQSTDSGFYSQPTAESVPERLFPLFSSGESYYYRSIDRLSLLKQTSDVSKDLSIGEREKCAGLAASLMVETMRARRSAVEEIEGEAGNKWVQLVQRKADEEFFAGVQRFAVGEIKVHPSRPLLNSVTCADQYLLEHPDSSLSALRPKAFPEASVLTVSLFKSTSKLTFIATSLFLSLFHNGFCRPQGEAEAQEGGTQTQEGTGMDEGQGDSNCTKELEDQQQLEGLRKEKEEEKEEQGNDMKGDAMDMDAEFSGEEGSAGENEDGEDEKGSAEGNERLLEDVDDVEMKEDNEQEVRDSANPDQSADAPGEQLNEQSKKGDIEDFEMPAKEDAEEAEGSEGQFSSESEEQKEVETLDVDKLSASEEEEGEDAEKPPDSPAQSPRREDAQGGEEQSVSEHESDEDIPQDPRYRNREFMDYENEAYGVKDRPANTKNVKNSEEMGNSEEDKVQGSDIISRLKKEWSGQKGEGEKSADASRSKAVDGTEDVKAQDLVEDQEAESGEQDTDAYKYQETAETKAAAPSDTQQGDIHPEELTHKREAPMDAFTNPNEAKQPTDQKPVKDQRVRDEQLAEEPMEVDYPIPPSGSHFSETYSKPLTHMEHRVEEVPHSLVEMEVEEPEVPQIDSARGKELWDHYQRLTQTAAQDLCEQLRIVLEATKANGLQGDYKTGKRINMKKVIGYIASRYRKDKIWLRRTKNTSREYQVLLAIDDSFSMSEHDLGASALKGLCVLVQALRSLEVGELAVAQIREGMTLVHDFKDPLTQEKSEEMMSQFRFDYGRKQASDDAYPRFLQQCIAYLAAAGKAEMQLVILISDGRLNKKQVRPYLLKAQNILFLCIILDNPSSSILSMKSTTFTTTAAGPQVELRPYLDDFPFAHYIVLENPNLLVESMCDVVRQWFDFVKEL